LAERTPSVVETLQEWAQEHDVVLVGSLPEVEGSSIFNTSFVLDSDGSIAGKYRKVHLFTLHGEDRHFGRGDSTLVCSTKAGKLGVMICYDLRFPELARRLALDGAEILCVSAQWPDSRVEHWSLLLRARAVENQLFVVGCNGCGKEGKLQYAGHSAVISPLGRVLAEGRGGEEVLAASVDLQEITDFRKLIGCFEDRVPAVY
jgi:predicted amidohydrolase